jgi:hypothetical protein
MYVMSVGLVTPKPDGFKALDVETSLRVYYSSQKGYEVKLAIQSTKLHFSSFYANAQCLVRQNVQKLNEKLKL